MIVSVQKKQRKNEVNEIEKVYVEEGIYSKKFTSQLIDFIGFVLNRYSADSSFPDDMVHFTYLRVMERLGGIIPEKPKLVDPIKSEEDVKKNEEELEQWKVKGKYCAFDASRSNLGNYIFSISRHAHSNFTYHSAKKMKELEPPPTEIPESDKLLGIDYRFKLNILEIFKVEAEDLPDNLRRFILWKQNI